MRYVLCCIKGEKYDRKTNRKNGNTVVYDNTLTPKVIIEYKEKYDEAETLIILGSEVEDKKGLKQAEKEYYNEAEEMLAEIPEDYKQFRELLADLW